MKKCKEKCKKQKTVIIYLFLFFLETRNIDIYQTYFDFLLREKTSNKKIEN